ncbi:hypothetical protein [Lysobacter capsici]|uniref:hypothetical protein n=1 Tax=Lysobacter capsici TaxID=435897 RepID=UPI001BFFEDF6|nr:hypothetical protein [Lysobacter capsici]QWF18718.1 hypothetical protein KME82_08240 [Lysobacter capsici]
MSNSKIATAITAGLRAILLYIRPAESVEKIAAQLHATHGRLLDARERHNAEAKAAEEKAAVMIRKAISMRAEAGRAHRVASRLNDLLS